MKDLLYIIVDSIAHIHSLLLKINDRTEAGLSDKALHFIIIGAFGLCLYIATHFVFVRLAKKSVSAIAWLYTFTVVIGLTLAIEIGQHITSTGAMEAMDILRGVEGVAVFGIVYTIVVKVYRFVQRRIAQKRRAD